MLLKIFAVICYNLLLSNKAFTFIYTLLLGPLNPNSTTLLELRDLPGGGGKYCPPVLFPKVVL